MNFSSLICGPCIQWSSEGRFVDNATMAVLHRNLPAVEHEVAMKNGWCVIKVRASLDGGQHVGMPERPVLDVRQTRDLVLKYQVEGEPEFDRSNLVVSFLMPNGRLSYNHPLPLRSGLLMWFLLAGKRQRWNLGMEPTGNLMGTIRTLDRANGAAPLQCSKLKGFERSQSHCSILPTPVALVRVLSQCCAIGLVSFLQQWP